MDSKDKLPLNAYHSPSPMNELAEYICSWERKKVQWNRSVVDTSCLILDNDLKLDNRHIIKQIKHIINDFAIVWRNAYQEKDKCDDDNDIDNLDAVILGYKEKLSKIVSDPTLLANYVIKASYSNISTNKTLAWSGYGDTIISNLKKNTPKIKHTQIVEVKDYVDNAKEYLGKYYVMIEDDKTV